MLSCKEVGELLSKGLDRKLSFKERMGLKIHLFICKTCSCYEKQLDFIARSAKQLMQSEKKDEGLPPLSEEAGTRISSQISQQLNGEKREN